MSSSESLNLTSVNAVEKYIANTPFDGQSVTYLTGGTVNYLYRIHLRAPFEGSETVILKHAQPVTKDWQDTAWDLKRQVFEVEAMTRVRSCLPSSSIVTIPAIYHFDTQHHVIIMQDCGPDVTTLTDYLTSGGAGDASSDAAKTIGVALGKFLAFVHEWSRSNPDGILDLFDENTQAKDAAAEFYYDRVAPTLDGTDKDAAELAPLLEDVQVDQVNVQLISTLAQEYRSKLMFPRVPGRDVFVMGDFWHSNILIDGHAATPRVFVLDWEVAKRGLPGSDVGLFCGGMNFLVRGNQVASGAAASILQNFIEAYARNSTHEDAGTSLAQDTLFHWGGYSVFWGPRYPPGGKEVVKRLVMEGVEFMIHSRNSSFLAQSPVLGLLPK